jgi:superfamily II DNA or RNA helicase
MKITADNLWAHVEGTQAERDLLRLYLTVQVKNAEHSEAYQSGHWDGTVKLFDGRRERFATGLVRMVVGYCREKGVPAEVVDARAPHHNTIHPNGAWLRPYQREAVDVMLRRGRGILMAPTGSGKSEIAAALTQAVQCRWLILVDTRDLMHQMAERISLRTGTPTGLAGDGEWSPRRVTVATLQTLLTGIGQGGPIDRLLESAGGIIADEVQVLAADEFRKVAMATPNAWWRFGVSATPLEREDEADYRAIEALGPLIHEIPVETLFELGHLARPEILMVEFPQPRMTGSYPEVYEAGVVLSDARNALVAKLAARYHAPRPTLIFFKSIYHGKVLAREIGKTAVVEVVSGVHGTKQRDKARGRLTHGHTEVLITSKIFNKGIDIPEARSGINAAGGASRIDALQKVGRGMRVVPGKTTFRYWDILDTGNYNLEDHARKRMEAYRSRNYNVRVVRQRELVAVLAEMENAS